jgi:alkanesulfonate monooxygenase SsuD/methylene tetrahydromethanopterin reductase-like flavin-dependent oxidoreductase (luciferase family)
MRQFTAGNLLGTPDEVIQQIRSFQQRTTVDHMGVVMLGENTRELLEDMQLFARDVMPAFATDAPAFSVPAGRGERWLASGWSLELQQ